jgi:hypothetical protein
MTGVFGLGEPSVPVGVELAELVGPRRVLGADLARRRGDGE